jgi:two-component system sensor histidine kinase RegB
MRLGTLTSLRWFAVAGQLGVLVFVAFILEFPLPLGPVLAVISAGIWLNLYATFAFSPAKQLTANEIIAYLCFDTLQISAILFLTGGVQNPFSLWLIMQGMLAASSLRPRKALIVLVLVTVCLTVLTLWHYPLPWREEEGFALPRIYNLGLWAALMLGVSFTAAYAHRVANEHRKLTDALHEAQLALAREERLTALDGLAAAAAHELGTPLATIQLTAKEMQTELPEGALREDAALLISQTQRCQAILQRLSAAGHEGDAVHNYISLDNLLREAAMPMMGLDEKRITLRFDPESGPLPERMRRRPEIIYGLRNLIENAHKYARETVEIIAVWDDRELTVTIKDDGPGISSDMLLRLGEPYPRQSLRPPSDAKGGLGLGFFIAKTLLERSGAVLNFGNRKASGAFVAVTWLLDDVAKGSTFRATNELEDAGLS